MKNGIDWCELDVPGWAVVSSDGALASGLTYPEAADLVDKNLDHSGICIVTVDVAARMKANGKNEPENG